jgi:Tfp pilus assembly protein FimT
VLSVISILVVAALPRSIRQLQLYRLDTSVSIVGNKLMEARMNAIKRNRTTWLLLDKTAKRSQIKSTNASSQVIDVSFPEQFPQGMILDSSESVEVRFDSMGRLSGGTQTITLKDSNSGKRKDIRITPSGKITVGQMY